MDTTPAAPFSDLLRRYRMAAGLTRETLAERAGLSVRGIADLERGARRAPYRDTVQRLSAALALDAPDQQALAVAARPPRMTPAMRTAQAGGAVESAVPPSESGVHETQRPSLSPTPLIGRTDELAGLVDRLLRDDVRLLTLTGPPGVGKTTLAQHLSVALAPRFPDGVVWVELDAITDPALVPAAVARALGIREQAGASLTTTLTRALADRRMLLALDNYEHLLDAAPFAGELLAACPHLKLLATSRAPLRLRWEQQAPVEPLALPPGAGVGSRESGVGGGRGTGAGSGERGAGENDEPERRTIGSAATPADSRLPTPDSLRRYAAVELFLARARAVRPALTLTPETAGDVAAICTLLDGLPLAIELAAARVNVFSVQEIADRLGDRLALLTGGYRDLPARHRTLRAAIDWSYELLSDEEQHLFRLLSIFGGGCTLDALEHVTGESGALETPIPAGSRPPAADFQLPTPLADLLGRLIDHSLIRRREDPDGTSRFRMLETIREFAGERLDAAGGGEDARLRHAVWFVALSDLMQSKWTTPEELPWLARLDAEYDNLRGVLQWTLDHGRAPLGLEIAGGLARFWSIRGLLREGRDRLEGLLARGGHAPPRVRARALMQAGAIADQQSAYDDAAVSLEGALALARETDDHSLAGDALVLLGINRWRRSDFGGATASLEEALAIARAIGRTGLISRCLNNLGVIMIDQGRLETARAYLEEGLVIAREAGDARGIAARLNNLAMVTIRTGDLPLARVYAEEALAVDRGQGNAGFISIHLRRLGEIVLAQGNIEAALRYATEALAAAREVGNLFEVAEALDHLARVAYQRPDMAAAGRYARESLRIAHELDTPRQIWMAMDRLGHVARGAGEHDRAVRLYAAAGAVRATTGEVSAETSEREIAEYLTDLRGEHGDEFVSGPWTENAALSREQAIAYALTDAVAEPDVSDDLDDVAPPVSRYPRGAHPSARSAPYPDGLTEREVQVLRLLAAGLSNRAIAERLVVSERAVKHHIASLSRKTGTGGRVDAAAYAHRHQLVGA